MALVDSFTSALERMPGGGIILTSMDALADWSRGQSLWAMPMGTACCAMELIAASFSKFDFDRLGTFPRADPRHVDVMIVAGTITKKMAPAVRRLYDQMAEPKYVIAMGNCAVSGGIFYYDTYSVVRGAAEFMPVDVYVAGCPPRPEALQDAVLQLREQIKTRSLNEDRSYDRVLTLPSVETERAGSTDAIRPVGDASAPAPATGEVEQP